MISTLFISPRFVAYPQDVSDAVLSPYLAMFGQQIRHNILWKQVRQLSLEDSADTATITLNEIALTDWPIIIVKCVGSARVNTTAKDFDGTTAITGKLPVYGTSLVPGIAVISTYNLVSATVEALADDTVVEVFAAIAAEDDDSRLDTYA